MIKLTRDLASSFNAQPSFTMEGEPSQSVCCWAKGIANFCCYSCYAHPHQSLGQRCAILRLINIIMSNVYCDSLGNFAAAVSSPTESFHIRRGLRGL